MAQRWVQNTTNQVTFVNGAQLLPGEGIFVEDGPLPRPPLPDVLSPDEVGAIKALVSGDGILGIGRREKVFGDGLIPDPRKRAGISSFAITESSTTPTVDPTYTRRIVVTMDVSATTSGVTAAAGQDLTLFPNAAAAGLRWDEPNRPFRTVASQANNSVAVINIREA